MLTVMSNPCSACNKDTASLYPSRKALIPLCVECAIAITKQHMEYAINHFTSIVEKARVESKIASESNTTEFHYA